MPGQPIKYFSVKEKSLFARVAARKLKSKNVAMVLGRTIHLHGVTAKDFLADEKWLRHELQHVAQYEQHGRLKFLVKYIAQTIKHGYYNACFEREARAAENDKTLLAKYQLKSSNTHNG